MMGWARVAQKEVEQLDETSRSILEAYCAGVNAYLEERRGSELSFEHALLRLTNRHYQPEPWSPLDSMVWGKVMSWDLGMNMSSESARARLLKYLSPKRIDELYPPYPEINPLILSASRAGLRPAPTNYAGTHALNSEVPIDFDIGTLLEDIPLQNRPDAGIGSNNWVISGNRTTTGKPLIANDPHLGVQMPNIWYQVHLQCFPESEACSFNVAGFSMPGTPGVIIGHNQRIAWAFTNIGPDVMDLFIEKLNPQNPDQYEVHGAWIDMEKLTEEIRVSDAPSERVEIRYTRHGPVFSDHSKSTKDIHETTTTEMPQQYAIALRWTALDVSTTFPAIWKMNLARNWEEFRAAASHFDVPSQNLIYADVDGNIGYQFPGRVPIRKNGDGRYPVPGWTGEYDWIGFLPFEQLPRDYNPSSGYLATANNAVVSESYPHFVSKDWDYGWRAKRIVEMIETKNSGMDLDYMKKMQGDSLNYNAQHLIPVLMEVELQDPHLFQVRNLLSDWDYQQTSDSSSAALFEVFWKNLLEEVFYDELPANFWPGGGSRWIEIVRHLLNDPDNAWWDNRKTSQTETRDEILKEAFRKAVEELETKAGKNPAGWKWGELHSVTFRNESFGRSGIKLLEWFFNRGPYPTGGGTAVVNATSWDASESYEVTALPSMRMIVDLSDFNKSLAIHTTGQSGHPFHPHYIDMAERWSKLEYLPMLWDRSSIEANAEGTLRLLP
jgi:penicillin amidase